MAAKDYTLPGSIFSRLTVVGSPTFQGEKKKEWFVLCRCECGVEKEFRCSTLANGDSKSCGCLARELASKRLRNKPWPIIGDIYGKLTIVGTPFKSDESRWYVACRCQCGIENIALCYQLSSGHTKSCGCVRGHKGESNLANRKHGLAHGPEWRIYYGMLHRCYLPSTASFDRYGGRGITVCERWRESVENFYADMGPRPSTNHSIDRIDANGNYEPSNCRWATPIQQQNNRSSNRHLDAFGEVMTVSEWARKQDIAAATIGARLRKGWPVEKALSEPLTPRAQRSIRSQYRTV